jgi:hypothetical protein
MTLETEIEKRKKDYKVIVQSNFNNQGYATQKIFDAESGRLLKYYVIDNNYNIIASQ